MYYEMEELLPIVASLAEKYTSKESTSVTYERARHLMEAVVYCIQYCEEQRMEDECENDAITDTVTEHVAEAQDVCFGKSSESDKIMQLSQCNTLTAEEAYRLGYENLLSKVKNAKTAYQELMTSFCAYGNENYHDTVAKAIPGFFKFYDVRFAPQETIITMDYPTICPITECSGIDAIERYVTYISFEQKFMGALPEEYVCEVLRNDQAGYRKQFYNICSVVLRHILGCMLIGRPLRLDSEGQDYAQDEERLCRIVKSVGKKELQSRLSGLLEQLVWKQYDQDAGLYSYLNHDIDDFTSRLMLRAE